MKIETVSVLQVPHHDSKANWKALRKCKIKSKIYLIPFGYGNRYRHPNINEIYDLIFNKEEFYCVTKNQGFFYYIDQNRKIVFGLFIQKGVRVALWQKTW